MHPIFIPSKGRAGKSKFIAFLIQQEIKVTIFVEPQELHTYSLSYPMMNVLPLEEDDKGITYVRNYIRQFAEDMNIASYWMCDDDIDGLYIRVGKKMIRSGIEVLISAQSKRPINTALYALEYQQLAWSAEKETVKNSYCDVCVLVDVELTRGMRYDPFVEGKEDRDFAMQCVAAELGVQRTTLYAFSAPKNGSNAGGLKEIFYDKGWEASCVANMIEKWGTYRVSPIIKPDGRRDVKIFWQNLKIENKPFF